MRCPVASRRVAGLLLAVAALGFPGRAAAQRVALEFLATGEVWKTDDGSFLLAQNEGDPGFKGSLQAWGVVRPLPTLQLVTFGEAETEEPGSDEIEVAVDQLSIRYQPLRQVGVEGGRMLLPIGGFAPRRFANSNPVIGAPDSYPAQYPWGFQVFGALGMLDYRVGLFDLPAVNERYLPAPGEKLRPAAAVGIRTGPDLRVGLSFTRGPYLGQQVDGALPPGTRRGDFSQTVVGLEAHYSRGHLDAWGDLLWSKYEVPTLTDDVTGLGGYVELSLTLTPRIFVAGRFEGNRYAFVLPISPALWLGTDRRVFDAEVGAGYRLTRDGLIKVSYRRDYWPDPNPPGGPSFPDGYALAVQLSWLVDVGQALSPRE